MNPQDKLDEIAYMIHLYLKSRTDKPAGQVLLDINNLIYGETGSGCPNMDAGKANSGKPAV